MHKLRIFFICAPQLSGRILFAPSTHVPFFTRWLTMQWHVLCNWGRITYWGHKRKRSLFHINQSSLEVYQLSKFFRSRFSQFLSLSAISDSGKLTLFIWKKTKTNALYTNSRNEIISTWAPHITVCSPVIELSLFYSESLLFNMS